MTNIERNKLRRQARTAIHNARCDLQHASYLLGKIHPSHLDAVTMAKIRGAQAYASRAEDGVNEKIDAVTKRARRSPRKRL